MKIGLTYTSRTTPRHTARSDSGCSSNSAMATFDQMEDAEEEFDSPETIAAIADALTSLGHTVELLGDGEELVRRLLCPPLPELVFNIAEGRGISRCREGWAPSILEMFGVPYTGSDPLTLATTLDKNIAKRLVQEAGVAAPAGVFVDGPVQNLAAELAALPMPVIVKPAFEGSSKGITRESVVERPEQLHRRVLACQSQYCQAVLVEQFIDGEEITVGMVGNHPAEVLGIQRVVPLEQGKRFVYGLDVKRNWRAKVRYEIPACLSAADEQAVRSAALTAFRALGCRDVARLDFRLDRGVAYFLEANPLPGLTPGESDLVLLAQAVGIGYRELIGRILNAALERLGIFNARADDRYCASQSSSALLANT